MLSAAPVISSRPVRCPAGVAGSWSWPPLWAADGLDHGVKAGRDQQRGADPVRSMAEGAGQAPAQQQADDRHGSLEEPEDHPDPQPGVRIDPADPDAHGGGEVRQPQRQGHQQQAEHGVTVPR